MQIKTNIVSCHTADSKPVKQEVNSTVILPPLVFPAVNIVFQNQDTLINFLMPRQSGKCQNHKGQKVKGPGAKFKEVFAAVIYEYS